MSRTVCHVARALVGAIDGPAHQWPRTPHAAPHPQHRAQSAWVRPRGGIRDLLPRMRLQTRTHGKERQAIHTAPGCRPHGTAHAIQATAHEREACGDAETMLCLARQIHPRAPLRPRAISASQRSGVMCPRSRGPAIRRRLSSQRERRAAAEEVEAPAVRAAAQAPVWVEAPLPCAWDGSLVQQGE